jgi:ribosomal protein S18 acetylase RimI-like enzyme
VSARAVAGAHAGEGAARVRAAAPDDLATLTALWVEITRHHEPLDPLFRLRPGAEGEVRELLHAWLRDPDARALLAEAGGAALGMVCVRIDRAPPILEEVERGEITDLFVRGAWRRRGVGRALADAALDWLASRGVRRVEVRVADANAGARSFWRALGFGAHVEVLQRRLPGR